jgi:hypothetical protein
MRKPIIVTLSILLIGAALLSARLASLAAAQTPVTEGAQPAPRTLSVSGVGRVSLEPDLATISIGVHSENASASEAVSTNNSQAAGVLAALKAAGVADKDIRTTNFSIYPRQEFSPDGKPTGLVYVVDNTVLVTVRDLARLGSLLDSAVKAGANSVSGIQFTVEDPSAAYEQALQAAVRDARSRGEALAAAAGVEIRQVLSINAGLSSGPQPLVKEFRAEAAMLAADVPVSSGQIEVSVDVSVVYEIQ